MSSAKDHELFEIAEPENIGTEILDPTLPSNLDFDSEKPSIELADMSQKARQQQLGRIDLDNEEIRSYSVKGKVIFNLEPHYQRGAALPSNVATFPVKCYNDESSGGLKGIWQSLVGYVGREMYIQQGYIYLLHRQKDALVVVAQWKLVNLFKVFLDLGDSRMRLVIKEEGSEVLAMKDYESAQLKELLARLGEQINSIGLSLVG